MHRSSVSLASTVPLTRWLWACHFCTKLFVGGLSYDTNETILKNAFERHGEITEVKIICDRVSGKSEGYGFVQFTCESAASTALKEMSGQLLDGRNIRVLCTKEVKTRSFLSILVSHNASVPSTATVLYFCICQDKFVKDSIWTSNVRNQRFKWN